MAGFRYFKRPARSVTRGEQVKMIGHPDSHVVTDRYEEDGKIFLLLDEDPEPVEFGPQDPILVWMLQF